MDLRVEFPPNRVSSEPIHAMPISSAPLPIGDNILSETDADILSSLEVVTMLHFLDASGLKVYKKRPKKQNVSEVDVQADNPSSPTLGLTKSSAARIVSPNQKAGDVVKEKRKIKLKKAG